MGVLPTESEYTPMSQHRNILQEIVEGSSVQDTLVHSYKRSFNGFSAKLTEKEVQKLSGIEGIVSIFPNRIFQLQTTRSWDFIGLPHNVKRMPNVESDTIVGVIDTGIWPESASFSDNGFGPPPKKWKGVCDGGHNFTCNNKLIGARYYEGLGSARDTKGHGTHTASTAAGNIVKGASFFEIAKGNARGAVPSARIAAYKVCGSDGCPSDAILAGFDDAIADGVDIISVSLSNSYPSGFNTDPIAIGSFHAVKKGILTSQSAGNNGPASQTVTSNAPWLLTVAASSTDRRLMDKIIFGNGMVFQGLGVNSFNLNGTEVPLLYGDNVSTQCDLLAAKGCQVGCLDKGLVRGNIVICDSTASAVSETFTSGVLGTIMITDPLEPRFDDSKVYPLPAVLINTTSGDLVRSYFKSTLNPVASILPTESIKDSEAPVVVSFSSRGPNLISPDIVKPDISAPGVDILAAFSPVASPSRIDGDTRSVKYSILSGTSMSCPHATGAAAYVKTYHPDWSPSAIKSALMTTALAMNNTKNSDAEFAYGSGQIDPVKAVNPGLIYDASADDYVQFLCGLGYDSSVVKLITNGTCPISKGTTTDDQQPRNLNYPSFGALVQVGKKMNVNFTRTVTNVGTTTPTTYKAKITTSNDKITVTVEPKVLSFSSLNEKKSFVVNVIGHGLAGSYETATASLVWSDEVHIVRSPIVVYTL
ncbi:subtilisin-like protease SBT4.13 [Papaver somniferum]|nr:subtilisin-like protease SBT4.13 [Papaver somniferum]